MSDVELTGGGSPLPLYTTNPIIAGAYAPGTPVYKTGGKATAALATTAAASRCIGLMATQGAANGTERGHVQFGGLLTLTTAEWDARVTGQTGGLTAGSYYYVSDAAAGKLLAAAPTGGSGHFVAPVGLAVSSTGLLINCPQPSVVSSG